MWSIDIPKEEIAAILKDRNISVKQAILDYVDSELYTHDLLDMELQLEKEENIVRCIECGYWTDQLNNQTCKECNDSKIVAFDMRKSY